MRLPTNIDLEHPDDPHDPSVVAHQQHHDHLHSAHNAASDAFDVAVSQGFVGTFQDWFESFAQRGNLNHVHSQSSPSTQWVIDHNLGFKPAGILVNDSAGTKWICGDVEHPTINRTILNWSVPFSGTAVLS